MNYDDVLNAVLRSVDSLKEEIDTDIRKEFSDFDEWLDLFVSGLNCLNNSDFLVLTNQLQSLTDEVEQNAKCTCENNTRWHSCLSRINSAFQKAARQCNLEVLRMCLEEKGVDMSEVDISSFDIVEHEIDEEEVLKVKVPDYVPEDFK